VVHVIPFAPNCTDELRHISIHMVNKTRDEWTSGYDGIWMNKKYNNTFEPFTDVNCL
jgi:hypothetical protein